MVNIDDYIHQFPPEIQEKLRSVRETIREASPEATEGLSFGMPVFRLNGKRLLYFAAHTNHIGLYALPSGHLAFKEELKGYKQGKGSVQFPYGQPLPLELIGRIAEFRTEEERQRAKGKSKK
ncbi:MAG TPA: DUF1801 domain-containing protein [Bacteroidales bacterium]|nr:DUF1801 domain-containing protein [Bacteroidales bacterium]